jgi:polyhydroxyalkanoate synthesis repressor PhaR
MRKRERLMHKIKKYANRKMYDTTDKQYVSMTQVAALIKSGEEIIVTDNQTGDDITSSIVSQLIAREKKGDPQGVSSRVLVQLLRKGSDTLTDYARKYASVWQNAFTMAEDELDKFVNLLIKNKELSKSEGRRLKNEIVNYSDSVKDWVADNVDKRINEALGMMNLATRDEVAVLSKKIDALSRQINKLEKTKPTKAAPGGRKRSAEK